MPKMRKELEWNSDKVKGLPQLKAACFHEFLREANLAGKYDRPWLSLSEEKRKELARHYRNLKQRKTHLTFTPNTNPYEKKATKPVCFRVRDRDAVIVTWTYTDKEILQGFAKWLKENRPKDSKPTKQGEKHTSQRVHLEQIALHRLLSTESKDTLLTEQSERGVFFRKRFESRRMDKHRLKKEFFNLFPEFEKADILPRCLMTHV